MSTSEICSKISNDDMKRQQNLMVYVSWKRSYRRWVQTMIMHRYVLIVAKRVMMSTIYVTNATKWSIATPRAKRNTDTNIKNNVRDELLNYTMRCCLDNLPLQRTIVQFVSSGYRRLTLVGDIWHAVGNVYAVDVFMHLDMITKAIKLIIKSVRFVELHILPHMRKWLNGRRKEWI